MSDQRIGWLGTGRMGTAMATRVLRAGHDDMTVWNRTASKTAELVSAGAEHVDHIADLATCDIIFTTVMSSPDLLAVTLEDGGLLVGETTPKILVGCSTVSQDASEEVRRAAAHRGTAMLSAPISGNRPWWPRARLPSQCPGRRTPSTTPGRCWSPSRRPSCTAERVRRPASSSSATTSWAASSPKPWPRLSSCPRRVGSAASSQRTDVHTHFIPPFWGDALPDHGGDFRTQAGARRVSAGGGEPRPRFYDDVPRGQFGATTIARVVHFGMSTAVAMPVQQERAVGRHVLVAPGT